MERRSQLTVDPSWLTMKLSSLDCPSTANAAHASVEEKVCDVNSDTLLIFLIKEISLWCLSHYSRDFLDDSYWTWSGLDSVFEFSKVQGCRSSYCYGRESDNG
jgi:hypothetical protein